MAADLMHDSAAALQDAADMLDAMARGTHELPGDGPGLTASIFDAAVAAAADFAAALLAGPHKTTGEMKWPESD